MNTSCVNERLSSAASIVLSLWFASSGLAAVIGNAVVLWLFYKNESLRTISNRFLASLCVADFIVGLVIDPTWIAIRCWIQPSESQILNSILDMLWIHTTAATVFNLCCVSVDRFIAIRFPCRYQDILPLNKCYTAIFMVWLISFFLPFSRILSVNNPANGAILWLSLTFIIFVLPISVVTFCYFWIFKTAREQSRRITRETARNIDQNTTALAKQSYKAVKTTGFVLGVFIVSWMPCVVLSVVHHFAGKDKCLDHRFSFVVWPWIEAISFTSSAINPWIYYFRNSLFREASYRSFSWLFSSRTAPKLHWNERKSRRRVFTVSSMIGETEFEAGIKTVAIAPYAIYVSARACDQTGTRSTKSEQKTDK
ncbi:trace amine-associated receptor 7e-like [Orbicella faveolata]|uniref:trace amine-associated receptor 7e-like n=1 Tax=Orbicella faveolata TaxID=48498 RepID=UPI0009E56B16|nr:trace amine-associated receptor 7e-like [Orbicella faveolata]